MVDHLVQVRYTPPGGVYAVVPRFHAALRSHYLVAKCLFWLLVGCLLFFMFTFKRKQFRQVMLVGALSVVSGVVLRLFSLRSSDQTELVNEAYFLVAIGILYGLVWLGARYLGTGSQPSTRGKR